MRKHLWGAGWGAGGGAIYIYINITLHFVLLMAFGGGTEEGVVKESALLTHKIYSRYLSKQNPINQFPL